MFILFVTFVKKHVEKQFFIFSPVEKHLTKLSKNVLKKSILNPSTTIPEYLCHAPHKNPTKLVTPLHIKISPKNLFLTLKIKQRYVSTKKKYPKS